jgi:hypothetical protein
MLVILRRPAHRPIPWLFRWVHLVPPERAYDDERLCKKGHEPVEQDKDDAAYGEGRDRELETVQGNYSAASSMPNVRW